MQPKLPICHTTPSYFLKPISDLCLRLQSVGTGADLMFNLSLAMAKPDWLFSFLPLPFMQGRQTSLAGAYLDQSLCLLWFSYKDVFILPSLIISFSTIKEHFPPSLFSLWFHHATIFKATDFSFAPTFLRRSMESLYKERTDHLVSQKTKQQCSYIAI